MPHICTQTGNFWCFMFGTPIVVVSFVLGILGRVALHGGQCTKGWPG